MDGLLWLYLTAVIVFAAIAAFFSYRYEKKAGKVTSQDREITRKVFELSLLQEITNKIGYSLNIENIAETIALTVENLFDLSTVSYAIKEDGKIRIKTYTKEPVAAPYLSQLSKIIIAGMSSIDQGVNSLKTAETLVDFAGKNPNVNPGDTVSQDALNASPQTFFNIPLIINNKLVGMINISSKKKIKYPDEDTALLFKIVDTAQEAIQRLHGVIKTEESKLESLILTLPIGTLLFTVDQNEFKLSVINQAALDFLRLARDANLSEVLGRFGQDLELSSKVQHVFTSREKVTIPDAKVYDKDFAVFLSPVFAPSIDGAENTQDKLIGVALIMRDISPDKKLERVRADFTDMMMHELRAPLTAIRGAAALLLAGSLPPEDAKKMPRVILDSSNDMLSTVADFLDAAKIDEGKFKLNKMKVNIVKVIAEHVEVFTYAAREKNISITFDDKTAIPDFYFDQIRIGQVINNLISNSIKFSNEGGSINVKVEQKDHIIEVIVTDRGIGIPDSKKAILFTKFGQIDGNLERLRSAAGRSSGSSGLGLFISHEIVEAHNGKIWLDSTENTGTVAHFTLPLITEEEKKPEDAVSHPANLSN